MRDKERERERERERGGGGRKRKERDRKRLKTGGSISQRRGLLLSEIIPFPAKQIGKTRKREGEKKN